MKNLEAIIKFQSYYMKKLTTWLFRYEFKSQKILHSKIWYLEEDKGNKISYQSDSIAVKLFLKIHERPK